MWSRSRTPKVIVPREDFFIRNGEWLQEELISSCDGKSNPIRNFSSQELLEATNNFSPNQIVRKNEELIWYKGMLDGYLVAVKKFRGNDKKYKERCINEVAMLSQINHKNVLKLLGCCLETEVPTIVYEFASNGNLYDHIFGHTKLPWDSRLRIASEIAYAVSYIHSARSYPIIHRDIKSGNILLDENHVAKLSEFSFAISIPLGDTHVEDVVRGTIGFIAPEYLDSGKLTEKADVYSFGKLLLELLTGKTPWDIARLAEEVNVLPIDYFRSFLESNRLVGIVDPAIWGDEEVKQQQLAFAKLAIKCTEEMPMVRPTMITVTKELWQIERIAQP